METIISIIPENDNQRKLIQYAIQKGEKTLDTISKLEGISLFVKSSDRTVANFLEDLCNKLPIENLSVFKVEPLSVSKSIDRIDFQIIGKDNSGSDAVPITIYPRVSDFSFQVEGKIENVGSIFEKCMVERLKVRIQATENHRSLPMQRYQLDTGKLDPADDSTDRGLVDIEVRFKERRNDHFIDVDVKISGFQGGPRITRRTLEKMIKEYYKNVSINHPTLIEQKNKLKNLVATNDSRLIALVNAILTAEGCINDDGKGVPESLLGFLGSWHLNEQQLRDDIKKLRDFGIIQEDDNGISLKLTNLTIISEQKGDLVSEQIAVPLINEIAKEWFQNVMANIRMTSKGDEYLRLLATKGHVLFDDELYNVGESITLDETKEPRSKLEKYGMLLQKYESNKHRTFYLSRAVIEYLKMPQN